MPDRYLTISEQIRRRRTGRIRIAWVAVVVIVVAAAAVFAGLELHRYHANRSLAQEAKAFAAGFAKDWTEGGLDAVNYANASPSEVAKYYATAVSGLGGASVAVRVTSVHTDGSTGRVGLAVSWSIPFAGSRRWSYASSARLELVNGSWAVRWSPTLIYPGLGPGGRLVTQRVQAQRASILDGAGDPLIVNRTVVEVGVEPSRTKNPAALAQTLSKLLGVNAATLTSQIESAPADEFVYVTTLRQAQYQSLEPKIYPLPGTVFRQITLPLAPTDAFAKALLGSVGPATAQRISQSQGRYVPGEIAGLSGLESQYDSRLAGNDGHELALVQSNGSSRVLFEVAPTQGKPVATTLDLSVQLAADAALSGESLPSSLVAIQPSTGRILAVANGPDGGSYDFALLGEFPPGSSFKVVSAYALMQTGVRPDQKVDCPAQALVDGHYFGNAEHERFGLQPFSTDFAKSCNTAFVGLSGRLSVTALHQAALLFGLGQPWSIGTAAFSGSIPVNDGATDLAAAAFGQGRLLVSPLAMAQVAATADTGHWLAPILITDPAQPRQPTASPLNATLAGYLRTMMRKVVTAGTGTAALHVAGGAVYAKTGTAEYGNGPNPPSHAWFIGYQGDLAFAVIVQGGGFGGSVAAPIAAKFLDLVAEGY